MGQSDMVEPGVNKREKTSVRHVRPGTHHFSMSGFDRVGAHVSQHDEQLLVNAPKPPQFLPGNQHTCPQSCTSKQCFLEQSLSVWNISMEDGTYIVVADKLRRACGGEAFLGDLRVCAPQLSPLSGLPQVISLTTLRVSRPSCAKGKRSACISASNCTACSAVMLSSERQLRPWWAAM